MPLTLEMFDKLIELDGSPMFGTGVDTADGPRLRVRDCDLVVREPEGCEGTQEVAGVSLRVDLVDRVSD